MRQWHTCVNYVLFHLYVKASIFLALLGLNESMNGIAVECSLTTPEDWTQLYLCHAYVNLHNSPLIRTSVRSAINAAIVCTFNCLAVWVNFI